ncbi:Subunit of heteropentameric Replication factor C (RF-C) [Polyrhizophydium stewartii]|uniref:Subunit of heteropentameric Replication factor C (RF-C) n=1 Tax=Polyrhizophydium stewartii TaxID=2732419 RepID=A0ABR4NA96_9FUNG
MDVDSAPPARRDKGKGKAPDAPEHGGLVGSLTAAQSDALPWVEKYRPSQLDELISHADIISTINRFIDENRLPHLLLYGPPGTGKTSTILACARKLYGDKFRSMILELNASDDRGIDVVREQIKSFASTRKLSGFKLIILDEADAMTQVAQNALRRVIEQYTKNVRFCLICNYVGKIIPALQSRCTRFRFAPLQESQISDRLNYIVATEGVNLTESGRAALLRLSGGDMRRALNILQAVHAGYDEANEANIYACTGAPMPADVDQMIAWLFNLDFTSALKSLKMLKNEKGLALVDLLTELTAAISSMDMPRASRIFLLDKLAEIEYNISSGANEDIQLAATTAAFRLSVDIAEKASQSNAA